MSKVTRKNAKATVYVLYTGGTIGMILSEPDNPISPLTPASKEDLQEYIPGLGEKEGIYWKLANLVDLQGNELKPVDSSEINATHWSYMAAAVEKVYNEFDGFVILHGTDTMAYTASALSFMLGNLDKPVVITGSQLPISNPRTDAIQNLVNSIYIAGYKATELPLVPEVTICFGDRLLRGNRVRKVSTSAWQGFNTPNYPVLGNIGEHIKINEEVLLKVKVNKTKNFEFYTVKNLVTNVMDVALFPGFKAAQLEALLQLPKLKGIVLRTFGAGNAPGDQNFLDVIAKMTGGNKKEGKIIINVTQCPEGMVEMGLYAASSGLLERGVISGLDMTPEAALTKMMWLLSIERDPLEIQTQLQINHRGEQSESLFDVRYGPTGTEKEPCEIVHASAKPSGQFRKANFKRAVLRVSGAGFTETKQKEEISLRVFINLPSADQNTSVKDPHCAGEIKTTYEGPEETVLLKEITPIVNRVTEEGLAINITLIPVGGKKIWYKGLYLALFTKA